MKIGAMKLKKFLDTTQKDGEHIKPSHFAQSIGKFPSTIHRILEGKNCPDIQTAILIERKTNGFVKVSDWLEDSPIKHLEYSISSSGSINRK